MISFAYSLYAAESNRGKTAEISPQGDLHRKDREGDTVDVIAGNYQDQKETLHEFGKLETSVFL